jgi:hypothetical protein
MLEGIGLGEVSPTPCLSRKERVMRTPVDGF